MTLPRGLYDQLLTDGLQERITAEGVQAKVDELQGSQSSLHLLDLVARLLGDVLESIGSDDKESLVRQAKLIAHLLREIRHASSPVLSTPIQEMPQLPLRRLRAIGYRGTEDAQLPETGLAAPWLFTASKGSPTLLEEIRRESAACDQIDILVSFITVSGVRKLMDVLRHVTAADASGEGQTRIRVLTTTYTGATEQNALDMLARLNGCIVKVSLDGRRTRLHAKAWMFRRVTGFGSAYIGSANLSGAALLGGLEWTVKLTERGQAVLFNRAQAHFESLWQDGEFVPYHPDDELAVLALRAALRKESSSGAVEPTVYFDITAKQYQSDILEQLQFERDHGRMRNLLVAATGTGKTVMAALDYRRTAASFGSPPRLLFVAHRSEILRQALATYRAVLRDASFGEVLVGDSKPARHDHLFASIQSLTSQGLVERCGADYWHTVVIDECHHLAASQLDEFARAVAPRHLLGLTATPERFDGKPLAPYFDMRPDGSPAAELRLWQALDLQLLAPFEYFGCNDETDFSDVPWNLPGEREAIDRLVTGNQVRARMVRNEWERLSGGISNSKALIFCVSVKHARFMTEQFTKAGIPVAMVCGESSSEERRRAPADLASGKICGIVTVDLYNEGIDIPAADTLLFLRPTQSPLVFQQQLGRGLRLHEGKTSCLVLDFVGRHRADFRFDRLLSSITGLTRKEVERGVADGFSTLPSGCHIHLEPQARSQILANLRSVAAQNWKTLRGELASYGGLRPVGGVALGRFLEEYEVELADIYRDAGRAGWTPLRRDAGILPAAGEREGEAALSRGLRLLLHTDDPQQIGLMQRVAESGGHYTPRDVRDATRVQMLAHQLEAKTVASYEVLLAQLVHHADVAGELSELSSVLEARSRVSARELPGFTHLPLLLHARYSRRELLTATGFHSATSRPASREGVVTFKEQKLQLLLVTLDKSDGFHDRIAYHDYAVSPSRFHWQTQNGAGPETAAGRRYLDSADNGWRFLLFVRETTERAFFSCGSVSLTSADDVSGGKPINITWTLETRLPAHAFRAFSVIREI